jgi:hypothetical protein
MTEDAMGPLDSVKVLVVDEKLQEPGAYRRILERNDCQCFFASSQKDVALMPGLSTVDIVLSSLKIPGKSIHWLIALSSGSRASAFYSFRLEESYWWVPVLKLGKECLGTPAFPPSGFAGVFDQLVKEIRRKTMALSQVNCETFDFLPNPTTNAMRRNRNCYVGQQVSGAGWLLDALGENSAGRPPHSL